MFMVFIMSVQEFHNSSIFQVIYRETHKGWDFKDDCSEIIFVLTFMAPWSAVNMFSFFKIFKNSI